ncbi:hypothetical protein F4782DRAFT_525382 [Xylaria castorea]|nr:hypothetical protein F4782DRAFT_525382 [Xylaria castorea]
MYPEVLVVFIVVAVALANPLPAIPEVGIVTTASGHNTGFINMMSFLGLVPTSLTATIKVAFFKRQYTALIDSSFPRDIAFVADYSEVVTLAIIFVFLEITLSLITICTCILWRRERRFSQQNAERQRAEELLNSHPQPIDIELGAMHTCSAPQSLISNTEVASTAPNTPENQDTEGGYIKAETLSGPGAHDDGIRISVSKASNAEGRVITKAAIPEIYVTDTETTQASKQETSNLELDIVTSHTHVEGSCLEPSIAHPTYHSISYHPESEAAQNNTTESSDPQNRFLTSTASRQAANTSH